MKKRVLMPLLVAGLMVASVMCLDSCKKNQGQQEESSKTNYEAVKAGFERVGAPMVDLVIEAEKVGAYAICPYCLDTLRPNTYQHWHAFGTPPDDYDWSLLDATPHPEDEPRGVLDCLAEQSYFCPYSGIAEGDSALMQFYMDTLHVTQEQAYYMTLPRFHGHNISYVLGSNSGNGVNGYHNDFHVGGGVPFWPHFGDPTNP